jgi:hypothetical protein
LPKWTSDFSYLVMQQHSELLNSAKVNFWTLSELPTLHKWHSRRNTKISCFGEQCFDTNFWTAYRNDAYDTALKRYGNFASFSFLLFFQILFGLKLISNRANYIFADFSIFVQFCGSRFQTICRIDTNDTPLESCWLGATVSYWTFFQITYSLRADLKILDSVSQTF